MDNTWYSCSSGISKNFQPNHFVPLVEYMGKDQGKKIPPKKITDTFRIETVQKAKLTSEGTVLLLHDYLESMGCRSHLNWNYKSEQKCFFKITIIYLLSNLFCKNTSTNCTIKYCRSEFGRKNIYFEVFKF